ncbi:MAG: type II secretion system protein N [Pseudomonadota bacterium]
MTEVAQREAAALAVTPYLLLGCVVLVLALLARAPASLLQKALPAALPVQVQAWGGTVWNGQAVFRQGAEEGFLQWQLLPLRLLTGKAALQMQARGALDMAGVVELGPGSWRLQALHGEMPARLLQALLPPGWSLPGSVQAEQVALARKGSRGPWRQASGRLLWGGGAMQFNLGGHPQGATLPPLQAGLALEGETLVLSLSEAANHQVLAEARMAPDGTVETRLRERLLRYAGRSSGTDPDAVAVTLSQKPRP